MNPLEPVIVAIGLCMLVASAITKPQHATCPPGSYVEGVRPSGLTRCLSLEPDQDCTGARACHGRAPRWFVPIRIYCTDGQDSIVGDDGRTVGCQRRYGR